MSGDRNPDCTKLWEQKNLFAVHRLLTLCIQTNPYASMSRIRLSKYIGTLKHRLAKLVQEKYPDEVRQYLWHNAFWTESYYIASVGETNLATIQEYIEKRGTKRAYNKKNDAYWQKAKRKTAFHHRLNELSRMCFWPKKIKSNFSVGKFIFLTFSGILYIVKETQHIVV